MATTEPIRNKKHLRELAGYWLKRGSIRNYTLIVMGVGTALRIGDLLQTKWEDVYDEEHGIFYSHLTVTEKKTGKMKTIALNKQVLKALHMLLPYRRGAYIFVNNRRDKKAISRVQAWRIIGAAVDAIGLAGHCIAPHSLRKTMGYHAWKAGASPVILMDIYNHSSYEVTRRYLGVTQDDKDQVYLGMSLF